MDIVVTDIDYLLNDPTRLPPIQVDDNKMGVASDHDGVLIDSRNNWSKKVREVEERTVRPLPNSGILRFGGVLVKEDWEFLSKFDNSTESVNVLEEFNSELLDKIFPKKVIKISEKDQPWITPRIEDSQEKNTSYIPKEGKI